MTIALLRGRDHTAVEALAVDQGGPRTAIALGRGRHPKPYPATDPNEDVVAVVERDDFLLGVVADGHHGTEASEIAVDTVLEWAADDRRGVDDRELMRLLAVVNEAVVAARVASRTTLSLVAVVGRIAHWTTFGDSPVLVIGPQRVEQLSRDRPFFLGDRWSVPEIAARSSGGHSELTDNERLVLVSDGFSNFCRPRGHPAPAAADAIAGARGLSDAAEAIIRHAFDGGAGDNVAAAVLAPCEASAAVQ